MEKIYETRSGDLFVRTTLCLLTNHCICVLPMFDVRLPSYVLLQFIVSVLYLSLIMF